MSKIALYMRISVEDKIKQNESESITNQRMLLNDFLNKNTELKTYTKQEYVDDLAIIRLNLKNLELSRGLNKSYFLFLKLLQRSRFL